MDEVVVRLVGGMGNQMFQYAAAKAVALRSGANLVLDLSWFLTTNDRRYALAPLRITARTTSQMFSSSRNARLIKKAVYWLSERIVKLHPGNRAFSEQHFHFDPEILEVRAPVCLHGYFQSEKYFAEFRNVIASEFTVTTPPQFLARAILEKMASQDTICLHIRRGDYVANPTTNAFHGVCSLEYYERGLRMVSEGLVNPHCYIFSDDPQWVRANYNCPLPMSVMDIHGSDEAHEDLRLMTACKHFVIANSSLSWWGAWLGSHPQKRVVAPENWFRGNAPDTKDLIPERWARI